MVVIATSLIYGVYAGAIVLPERYDPWAALDPKAEPGPLTGWRLARAKADPVACMAALGRTDAVFERVTDRVTAPGCGFSNAVRLSAVGTRLSSPATLSCPVALSLVMWQRHTLQPAARRMHGEGVARIDHLGSYACRNVNRGEGAPSAARSRHATADAFDVAAFVFESGRRVTVLRDWESEDAPEAPADRDAGFLREAHRGACRYFDGVLGPEYNAVHADHFHLETGGWRMCR
ncbi:MAG: extensin family protein [Comamonadaceae bacterium]|nr:MAG: extensin family protein [Comamonadaceae bacterium]